MTREDQIQIALASITDEEIRTEVSRRRRRAEMVKEREILTQASFRIEQMLVSNNWSQLEARGLKDWLDYWRADPA